MSLSQVSSGCYLLPLLLQLLLLLLQQLHHHEASGQQSWLSFGSMSPEYRPQNVINSLITPMIPRSECYTSADNRAGICMSKKACASSGGISAGSCGVIGTCCIYQGSCRSVVNANESYFVSPSYPNTQVDRLDPPICIFTLERNNIFQKWPVCQVRIDFDEFTLAPPVRGSCSGLTDSFVISGASNFNTSGLPETGICGDMSGQHMYFNVDPEDTSKPLLLVINAANDRMFNRKWSIRIRQIPCKSPTKAPPGCLQYYTTTTGVVESFNFRGFSQNTMAGVGGQPGLPPTAGGNGGLVGGGGGGGVGLPVNPLNPGQPGIGGINVGPGGLGANGQALAQYPSPKYMNSMRYGVCIAQQPMTCGIRWEASDFDFGGNRLDLSGVGASQAGQNFGCTVHSGGGSLGDQGDYLLMPGCSRDGINDLEHLFCGQRLNALPDQNVNAPLISFMKPFVVYVRTDASAGSQFTGPQNQRGFQLQYETIPCS